MNIESEALGIDVLKIVLSGRMDVAGAQEIDLKFTSYASGRRAVIVDMSAVNFLASIGIRTLLVTAKTVAKRGGKMVLLNPDSIVTNTLKMADIDAIIPICRSLDEALQATSA
jgi:anti-anti-sigma factor